MELCCLILSVGEYFHLLKYIGMIHFKDDQFEVTTATTVEEAKQVLSAGFEYVTEKNGIMLFRKPKRFSKYVS
jgi:hypothetical protein